MNVIIPLKAITFIIIGSKFVISSDTSDISAITVNDSGSTTGLTGASPISVVDPAASSSSAASTTEFTLASLVISDPAHQPAAQTTPAQQPAGQATPAHQSSQANSKELDAITVLDHGVGTGHHTYVGGNEIIEDSSKLAEATAQPADPTQTKVDPEDIFIIDHGFPNGHHMYRGGEDIIKGDPAARKIVTYEGGFPDGWHDIDLVENPKPKTTPAAPVAEPTANQVDLDDILIIDNGFPAGHHMYVGGEDIIKEETAPSSEPAKSMVIEDSEGKVIEPPAAPVAEPIPAPVAAPVAEAPKAMVIENADGTTIAQGPAQVIQAVAPEAKPIAAEAPKVTEIVEPTKTHVARPIVPEKTEESKTKLDEKKADDAEKKKEKEEDKEKKDKKEEKKLGKTKKTKDAKGKPLKTGFHIPVYGVAVMVASGFVLVVSVAVVATAKK